MTLVPNHRGIVTSFSCNNSDFQDDHSRSMSLSNGSSHSNPLLHSSWKRIFALTVKGDINPIGSNILDAKLRRLLFVIGSWDETHSFGAMNLKQSDIKSHDTPRALSGSRESHSTSSDVALLSGSMPSITSFELLAHFVKLNAAAIMMADISY